jgi:excisionase family DNA binding protein
MTASQLLIPAPQAAHQLGISRRTLRTRINAGLMKSVRVGARVYIHKAELERIVNGEPKPEARAEISENGKSREEVCQNGHTSEFDRVLAEVESMSIFAGPNADQWNRVLARAKCERLKETP